MTLSLMHLPPGHLATLTLVNVAQLDKIGITNKKLPKHMIKKVTTQF